MEYLHERTMKPYETIEVNNA